MFTFTFFIYGLFNDDVSNLDRRIVGRLAANVFEVMWMEAVIV